jgi:FtsP/CotA-like multicopper oxidase with cupredoxin domain
MRRAVLAAALALAAAGAAADEVEAAIGAALEAYRAGELDRAKEELDYASTLLGQQKARGLTAFLPAAFDGWTREDGEATTGPAMLGGGLGASAAYRKGGSTVTITLMADNPMVATMGALLAEPAMMAMQGAVRRAGRQRYVETPGGELMAMVDNRVLVQVSGSAPVEDKTAYFAALDFDGLAAF